MDWLNVMESNFSFEEAILESIETKNLTDIRLNVKISEGNLNNSLFDVWKIPRDDVNAKEALERLIPNRTLSILCKNVAFFKLDRVTRHNRPEILLVNVPDPETPDAKSAPKTIFGFNFHGNSEFKKGLLHNVSDKFLFWIIDVVDGRLEIIFQELEIENFPTHVTS